MASDPTLSSTDMSNIAALIEELEEEIQCAVCQERLAQPRVLSCLHSFCETCLMRCYRAWAMNDMDSDEEGDDDDIDNSIKCPCCRKITKLPKDGIAGLKPDFRANRVGEILDGLNKRKRKFVESEYQCDVCVSNGESPRIPASDYCQECGQLFCEQCSKMHRQLPDTKEHYLVGVSALMAGTAKLRKTEHENATYKTCSQHLGERIKSFCKTCMKPVCFLCTKFGACLTHKDTVCALDEAVNEMLGVMGMLVDRLKHRTHKIDELLTSANALVEKTNKAKNASLHKLRETHNTLLKHLNEDFERALRNRETLFNEKVVRIQGMMGEILKMKTVTEETIKHSDEMLKGEEVHGTDLAFTYECLQRSLDGVPSCRLEFLNCNVSQIDKDVSLISDVNQKIGPQLRNWLLSIFSEGRFSSINQVDRPKSDRSANSQTDSSGTIGIHGAAAANQPLAHLPPTRRLSCPSTGTSSLPRQMVHQTVLQMPSVHSDPIINQHPNPASHSNASMSTSSQEGLTNSQLCEQLVWAGPNRPSQGLLYSPLTLPMAVSRPQIGPARASRSSIL